MLGLKAENIGLLNSFRKMYVHNLETLYTAVKARICSRYILENTKSAISDLLLLEQIVVVWSRKLFANLRLQVKKLQKCLISHKQFIWTVKVQNKSLSFFDLFFKVWMPKLKFQSSTDSIECSQSTWLPCAKLYFMTRERARLDNLLTRL